MELKFENRYFSTNEMLSEYVNKVLCKKIKLQGTILLVISFIMFILTWLQKDYPLSAVFGTCSFITLFVTVLSPFLLLKQLKQHNARIHNGKEPETIIQFGDHITITEGTFSLTLEYNQILKRYSLKHSYILMIGAKNAIILSPDHFTIGSFDAFIPFIESMCPNSLGK